MRPLIYSLRTGILAQLVFLIISAMLLINVVMVKFSEKDLTRARVGAGRLIIRAIEQTLTRVASSGRKRAGEVDLSPRYQRNITQLMADGEFSHILIIGPLGNKVFATGSPPEGVEQAESFAGKALKTGIWSIDFTGKTWAVMWLGNEHMRISAPLSSEGRPLGAITLCASLVPIYETIRKSEKIILLYILVDTLILALVGIVVLSRIVVKPINRLLKMTKQYKEGDTLSTFSEEPKNEIGELYRSLAVMLRRLDENKEELKAHISSLEEANEDLRRAQDEIIRSEKLASVGRLAAGVAHEIGNPIGVILGYLDLMKKPQVSEEDKKDFLDRIESEIIRINQIIRQLLDFSRPSSGKRERAFTHNLIKDTVNMVKPQPMFEEIRMNLELDAADDAVFADPNQLQQVFLNIIMNAVDAHMSGGAKTGNGPLKYLTIRSVNDDGFIEVRFIDNGPGIPHEEIGHIFDPFYTTKDPGKGTGLGLPVSYRIVEGLGGSIRAESTEGQGATIVVRLPLSLRMNKGSPAYAGLGPSKRDPHGPSWFFFKALNRTKKMEYEGNG